MMIRILIAEDEPEAAAALKKNIDGRGGILVLATAGNGLEAVELCRRYHPDVVLMDIMMPQMDGIEASRIILQENPAIKILILTLFAEPAYIQETLRLHLSGYILKGRQSEVLISCIQQAMAGFHIADQTVMAELDQGFSSQEQDQGDLAKAALLTETEKKVVSHIIIGRTNLEIANTMNFTEGYVRNMISRILMKTELPNSKALAAWGFRMGL